MQQANINEIHNVLMHLEQLIFQQQNLLIPNKQKQTINMTLAVQKKRPSHAELRKLTEKSTISSVDLIRQNREER